MLKLNPLEGHANRLSLSLPPQQGLLRIQNIQDPVKRDLSLTIPQQERALTQTGDIRDLDDHLIVRHATMNVRQLELRRITSTAHNP